MIIIIIIIIITIIVIVSLSLHNAGNVTEYRVTLPAGSCGLGYSEPSFCP